MSVRSISLLSVLFLASTVLSACGVENQEGIRTVENEELSVEAYFVELARESSELEKIKIRLSKDWPSLEVETSTAQVVIDDAFGEGDLLGVYFEVIGGEEGSFASLWFDEETSELKNTIVGVRVAEGDDVAMTILLDGEPETYQTVPRSVIEGEIVPKSRSRCLRACAGGANARYAFCRSLPDARLKAGCWAVSLASSAVCSGFCYAIYW